VSLRYAAKSDVGRVRQGNEDSYLVQEPLFVVADGMGGHLAGDVASRMAVDVLMHDLDTRTDVDREALVSAVQHANEVIFEESQNNPDLSGMGTTCTAVYLNGREARIAHVGDSRAYLLRSGTLSQLTDDHTLVNRMVKEGRIRPEDAERHPQRSIITRALGVDSSVKVDYKTLDLNGGDRLLLCSDGLTSMIDVSTIKRVLGESDDLDGAAERLVHLANEAGGEDNITVVLVHVLDGEAAPAQTKGPSTSIPVTREPARTDLEVRPERPSASSVARPGRWLRRLVVWLLALAVVGIGGYFAVDYFLDRAWYVGTNEDGFVTIYQGIPEEVLGLDLKDEVRATAISVDDLPEFLREDVEESIKVDSEEDARAKVADLRARARDAERSGGGQQNDGTSQGGNDGGGGGNE
jgi:PPM family protein phosphatase